MRFLQPIWDGSFVYQEPICFSADKDGCPIGGALPYQPEEILSVTSFDGSVLYQRSGIISSRGGSWCARKHRASHLWSGACTVNPLPV